MAGAPEAGLPRPGTRAASPALAVTAKVVTTELNVGIGSGCVNPYFPHIDPAGSSTGSAVAVAAGICDVSLGTDVLGSARWPAGRCGVVGLRTTHRPDRLAGIFPLSPSMDAPGWVARTADDLDALAGRLGIEGTVQRRPHRIGVVAEAGGAQPEILAALDRCGAALVEAGHRVRPVGVGEPWRWRAAAWELCAREAWDGHQEWRRWITEDLGESTRRALAAGSRVGTGRYAELRAGQRRVRAAVAGLFAEPGVDAWLLPLDPDVPRPPDPAERAAATSIPAPGTADHDREVGYTPLASFAGLPAITFPVGRSAATGAPLAVQLVGPPGADRSLVRLAREVGGQLGDLGFTLD
jgi:Asp-tRNA(Asn)/Glu-tRNA(Gln) amidotransferase A subunit family amidase